MKLGGNETIGGLAGGSATGGNINLQNFTLTVTQTQDLTYAGVISGTGDLGGLTKAGANTLTLSGANTYSGTTTITNGGITTVGVERIADASDVTMAAAGVFTIGGNEKINTLTGVGTCSIVLGNSTLTVDQDANVTFEGVISGNADTGGLTIDANSAGTLYLGGNNTYTGLTTINGKLRTTQAERIADASDVTMAATGVFTLDGNEKINTLTGVGACSIVLGNSTLTVDQDGAATFAGVISGTAGTGGLTIDAGSSAALTLSGINTYTGATTVNARTLSFNAINTGISAVTANNAGTKIAGTGTIPGAVTMNAGTILAPGVSDGTEVGILRIDGALTFNGASKYVITMTGGAIDKIVAGAALTANGSVPTVEFQAGYDHSALGIPATIMEIAGAYTAFTSALPAGYVIDGAKVGSLICLTAVPAAIPTLNEWGIIIMLLLLAGAGILVMRKRQRSASIAA